MALLVGCQLTVPPPGRPAAAGDGVGDWILLVLRSKTCGQCDVLEAHTLADSHVREALQGVSVQIVSTDEHPEYARRFIATAVPRMVFIRDGAQEAFLMGAIPPEKFLREWHRIQTGGPGTVRACSAAVHANPHDAPSRYQLGITLVLLGEVEGAELQLRTMATTSAPRVPDLEANLRESIDNARYLLLREDVLRSRAEGEVPATYALHGFVADATVMPGTRYYAGRMLAGVLNERIERARADADLTALRAERRVVLGITWVSAPRPLGEDERAFGLDVCSLLWTERKELNASDRDLAQQTASGLQTAFPDDANVQVAVVHGCWIVGKHEAALQAAQGLKDEARRREIIGDLD